MVLGGKGIRMDPLIFPSHDGSHLRFASHCMTLVSPIIVQSLRAREIFSFMNSLDCAIDVPRFGTCPRAAPFMSGALGSE